MFMNTLTLDKAVLDRLSAVESERVAVLDDNGRVYGFFEPVPRMTLREMEGYFSKEELSTRPDPEKKGRTMDEVLRHSGAQ
jgi:hypothetical protein